MNLIKKVGFLLVSAAVVAASGVAQNVQRTPQGIKYAACLLYTSPSPRDA